MSEQPAVLIVNHEKPFVDLLIQVFKPFRLSIFGASDASDAKRLIESLHPNLIILDPTIANGFALLSEIRSSQPAPDIVVMTDSEDVIEKVRCLGIDQIVVRDEGSSALIDTVVMFLGTWLPTPPQAGSARILVASSDVDLSDVLCGFLSLRGYSVATAASGREVIEIVNRDSSIAVAIVNVVLQEMGGIETLKELMKTSHHPGVIMMSGFRDHEIVRQAMHLGAFDYLFQPFDLEALEASVVACIADSDYHGRAHRWWKRFAG